MMDSSSDAKVLKTSGEDAGPSLESQKDIKDGRPVLSDGWQIDQSFGQCMLKMFDAQLWTDVTFRCFDQAKENLDDRLHAHKIILAARSPVFQVMLFGPCKDFNEEIEIRDIDSEGFEIFLRLLYSDDLDLFDSDDIVVILNLAHRYQMQEMVDRCCRKLVEKVSIDNACVVLDAAMLFENDNLISHVTDFIDQNAEKVLETDGFLSMSLKALTHILKGNTFYTLETRIFTRSVEWATKRCGSAGGQVIRKTLGDAFYYLRTPSMTHKDFIACTKKRGYYNVDEYEDISDYIAHPRTSEVVVNCNSTNFRHPRTIFLQRTRELERYKTHDIRHPLENLTIFPKDDVHLTSIHVKELRASYLEYGGKRSGCTLGFVPLYVNIEVNSERVSPSNHYVNSSEDIALMIDLDKPVLLHSGGYYNLKVTVWPQSVNGGVVLGAPKCKTTEHYVGVRSQDNIGSEIVSVQANGNCFQVVESITFTCDRKRH